MPKTSKKLSHVIGRPSNTESKLFGKNLGIANLLMHFNFDKARVEAYLHELIEAGWLAPNTKPAKFKENIEETCKFITTPVSEVGTVKPLKNPRERLSPDDEPEVQVFEDHPMFDYSDEERQGAEERYKFEMKKTERSLRKLRQEAFIGKQKVNRMAIAAASVKPAEIKLNLVDAKVKGSNYCVMPISDLHFGEVVQPNATYCYNKYNPEIAQKRLVRLFEETYRHAKAEGCDKLHILLLGDLISGEIHDELRESNAFTAPKCVSVLNSILIGIILEYAKLFKSVSIACVVGNHSRTGKKLQAHNRSLDNYEHIIYSTIKDRCEAEAKNITVEFDEEAPFAITTIGNQRWMIEHGDRYKGSTAAAGAINTVLRNIGNDIRHNHADVAIMGHWHVGAAGAVDAREDGRMTKVFINPSMVGPDPFAVTTLHAFYPAESNVFITDGNKIKSKIEIDLSEIQG
jgi:predicted phosphodiesterase